VPLLTQPSFQLAYKRPALFLPDTQTLFDALAVDYALDVKQSVNARDGLQRNRRDRRRVLAAPRIGSDIGQLEELAPGMAPAVKSRSLRSREA
jgi:hypothetical protein